MEKDDKELINLDSVRIEPTDLEAAEGQYERLLEVFEEVKGDIETLVTEENRHLHQVNEELRREVEERRRLENRLQDELEFLEVFIDAVPMPVGFTDGAGRYLGVNDSFLDFFALDRTLVSGQPWGSLYQLQPVSDAETEFETRNAKGELRTVLRYEADYNDSRNEKKGCVEVLADITQLRQLRLYQQEQEQLLIQQSKMAAMGEMIGNISHQWRQPLEALCDVIDEIKGLHKGGDLDRAAIGTMIEKGTWLTSRMSDTIDEFRNFFRPRKEKSVFSVQGVVEDTLELLNAALASSGIRVNNTACEAVDITGYKNEFSQVVLNILHNAKDVLEERRTTSGEITIRCYRNNQTAVLAIEDNAGGIDDTVMPHIYDPYFTTKQNLAGTGIGLYMAKTIVETNMHGRIRAENTAQGALFTIEVPVAD